QAVEHVLQDLGAGLVALGEPAGVAFEAAGGLAGQLIEPADIALAAAFGLEDLGEGFVLLGTRVAVGLGELRAKRRHRRREGGILAGEAGRTLVALGLVEVADRQAGYF